MREEERGNGSTTDLNKSKIGQGAEDNRGSEQALGETEEKFRNFVERANVGVYLIQDDIFRYVNTTWAEMLGYSVEEMVDKITPKDVVYPDDYRNFSAENIRKRLAGEIETIGYEVRLVTKAGEIKFAEVHGSRTLYKGKPAVIGTILDITRRRMAEEALLRSHERYRTLAEATFEGIIVTDGGRLLEVNDQFARMLGYKKSEVIGKSIESVVFPGERRRILNDMTKNHESVIEIRMIRKDGKEITVESHGTPFEHEGRLVRLSAVRDITERKLAELEIIREKSKLLSIFDNVTEMINVVDPRTNEILFANKSTRDAFGPDVVGDRCYRRFHNREDSCTFCADLMAEVGKGEPYRWERQGPATGKYYRQTNQLIQWIDGRDVLLNFSVDISDQKLAEKALKRSEANLLTFFNTIDDFLFVIEKTGTILVVNATVNERLGYIGKELIGEKLPAVYPVDRRQEVERAMQVLLADKATHCLVPLSTKEGKRIPVEMRITRGRWNDLDVFFGVGKDISEIRLSEEKFSKTFQSSGALMAISTFEEGRFIDVNEAFLRTLGYAREEIIGKKSSELGIFVDWNERDTVRQQVMEQGKARHASIRVRTKDGSVRYGIFSADPIYVQDTLYLLTTMNDVTDLKRVEDALQEARNELELRVQERTAELQSAYDTLAENERLYENLFDNAPTGMFQSRVDGSGFLRINKAGAMMLGYESPEEMMSLVSEIGSQVYLNKKDRRKFIAKLGGSNWYYAEQLFARKDGSTMVGKIAARKVLKPDGTTAYFEGFVEDITEQKRTEKELKTRSATLEEVNTALKVLVRQMGEDKKEMEARFVSNIKSLVLPYVEKVKRGRLDPSQKSCLSIIETNLNEIVSPFIQSVGQLGLSPRETQIAALIKDGKTTKEIAEIIGIAPSAVDTCRNKIRRKLNLNNKKMNLQSYLQSIK